MNRLLMGLFMLGLLNCSSTKRVGHLFTTAAPLHNKTFTYAQLAGLPDPVHRYFKYALPDGQPYLSYLRLQHSGTFKTAVGK